MATLRATGTAAVVLGILALLLLVAVEVLWIVVEVIIAITLFNGHENFLGGCMTAIVVLNVVYGGYLLGKAFR